MADSESKVSKLNSEQVLALYEKKRNVVMTVSIISIVILYMFFFMSSVIFQKKPPIEFTKLNEEQSLGEYRTVEVESWKYSKSQQLMEVQIGITNNSADGNDTYDYSSLVNYQLESKGKESLPVEIKFQEFNFAVIWIHLVPDDFNSCSLDIYTKEKKPNDVSVFTNVDKVEKVKKIKEKSEAQYHIEQIERNIKSEEKDIVKIKHKIKLIEKDILNINKNIKNLQNNEAYQSAAEISESEKTIAGYNEQIKSKQNEIAQCRSSISTGKSHIEEYKKLIEKIKQGDE